MVILFIILTFSVFLLFHLFVVNRNWMIRFKLRSAKRQKIEFTKDGDYIRISGEVIPVSELLSAPLSKIECVFYYVKVSEDDMYTPAVVQTKSNNNFLIKDGTAIAYINVSRATQYLKVTYKNKTSLFRNPTPEIQAFMHRQSSGVKNLVGLNRTLVYEESVLLPGDLVSVLGTAKWVAAESLNLPVEYAGYKILYLKTTEKKKLYFGNKV